MKKIAVSILNRVFAEGILIILGKTGDFRPVRIPDQKPDAIVMECRAIKPEILLMDVTSSSPEAGLIKRLEVIDALRQELPDCKMAILCDEIAYPELAREVMRAKQAGRIDAFFYASVTSEYLAAALDAI